MGISSGDRGVDFEPWNYVRYIILDINVILKDSETYFADMCVSRAATRVSIALSLFITSSWRCWATLLPHY